MMSDIDEALISGRLANPDAVLQIRESAAMPSGMRAIDVTPIGGVAIRVLPDRGLDISQAWFGGYPIAWMSRIGEVGPIPDPVDREWSGAFVGGLVATCGLRNVGAPSEGHGLHGTFSHLSATDVEVKRSIGDGSAVTVTGVVVDDREDPVLTVHRSITTFAGEGRIELADTTTNVGDVAAEAPVLYHCNFGYPLWSEGAVLDLMGATTEPRDDDSASGMARSRRWPGVITGPEWVFEHRNLAAGDGWARVTNDQLGLVVTVSWDPSTLPVLNQWIDANPGMGVLGIEPANCTTRGRAYDRANGGVPTIAAGGTRQTGLTIGVAST